MKRLLALLTLIVGLVVPAFGQSATPVDAQSRAGWSSVSAYTDGTPILDLAGYKLSLTPTTSTNGAIAVIQQKTVGKITDTEIGTLITNQTSGSFNLWIQTVTSNNVPSKWKGPLLITVTKIPSEPATFTITIPATP
jgi:hypothetical protein